MRYVEGWGSGFLRVNEELSDYGAHPVVIEDAGIATRLNVYRAAANAPADNCEDNEGNREGNEGNAAKCAAVYGGVALFRFSFGSVSFQCLFAVEHEEVCVVL